MELSVLPAEILILIIKHLDVSSLNSLYNSCKWIRNIVCMQGVVKQCHMSLNVMATARTLKLDFFKDISQNLVKLNMCGVPDLTKTAVLPALKRLKSLNVLDISYTNLNLLDIQEIYKACPTIKDITMNLGFGNVNKVSCNTLMLCQSVFEQFECVHFIGSIENLLISKLGAYLTSKARLCSLKYTVAVRWYTNVIDEDFVNCKVFPYFDQFTVFLSNWQMDDVNVHQFPVLSMIKFTDYEYVIILVEEFEPKVYASPLFHKYFKEAFNTTVEPQCDIKLIGNVAVMVWNKETNTFDDQFFILLTRNLKPYFTYYFLLHSDIHQVPAPAKYDWFYTVPIIQIQDSTKELMRKMKMIRQAPPNLVLNYDVIFKDKEKVELTLLFKYPQTNAIELTADSQYLKKLTYISLVDMGKYTADFFNILFRCCVNLATLNIKALPLSPCTAAIARTLPLSRSLRNIRLVDKRIDFKTLFSALSQCPMLENFRIEDRCLLENNDLADPGIVIEKCSHLYSTYVEAQMSQATATRTLQMFNRAKTRCAKYHLNVVVQQVTVPSQYRYDPFVSVFKLNPIKPI